MYPMTLKISDGLYGSGSNKVHKQLHEGPTLNTKNFIFGVEIIVLNRKLW